MAGSGAVRVLVRETIADAGVELLRAHFEVDVDTESPLEEIVGNYDALIVRSATKVDKELLERGTSLKVVGRAGVGLDNIDVATATRLGILVVNAPTSNVLSAAEHTLGVKEVLDLPASAVLLPVIPFSGMADTLFTGHKWAANLLLRHMDDTLYLEGRYGGAEHAELKSRIRSGKEKRRIVFLG